MAEKSMVAIEVEEFIGLKEDIAKVNTHIEYIKEKVDENEGCTKRNFKKVFEKLRILEDFKLQIITVVVMAQMLGIVVIALIK